MYYLFVTKGRVQKKCRNFTLGGGALFLAARAALQVVMSLREGLKKNQLEKLEAAKAA